MACAGSTTDRTIQPPATHPPAPYRQLGNQRQIRSSIEFALLKRTEEDENEEDDSVYGWAATLDSATLSKWNGIE